MAARAMKMPLAAGSSVVVVGLGNIGSKLVMLLARLCGARIRLTLVDPDAFSASNLETQAISRRDLGRSKAEVMASRVRRLNRAITVTPIAQPLEFVPRGLLRGSILVTAVDNNFARQIAGEASFQLAIPLVDTGIEGALQLARVSVYKPGPEAACVQCAFTDEDYQQLPVRRWCDGPAAPSSNAPAYLGALAASIAVAECAKLLSGRGESLAGHDVVVGVGHHSHSVTRHVRNPRCGFPHEIWSGVERLRATPGRLSLAAALRLGGAGNSQPSRDGSAQLSIQGHQIVTRRRCAACGHTERLLHISGRLAEQDCRCGAPMLVMGFFSRDRITYSELSPCDRRRSLRSIGFLGGDIFSVRQGAEVLHYQLGGR